MWTDLARDADRQPGPLALGERIARTARLLAAGRLYASLFEQSSLYRQRVMIGGAGPRAASAAAVHDPGITEDALPAAAAARLAEAQPSRRPSRDVGDPSGGPGDPLSLPLDISWGDDDADDDDRDRDRDNGGPAR